MANVIFVGWGTPVRGREQYSLKLFGEAIEFYTRLQQQGEIESFEAFSLAPHGGDLSGFLVVRGDPEKLSRILNSDEFMKLNVRAGLALEHFGVVRAYTGQEMQDTFQAYGAALQELA